MPVMKRPSMKPPALGENSNEGKLGSDLPEIINGGRFPSNSICPSKHDICIVFTVEPFAPDCTISCRLLSGNEHKRPAGKQVLQTKTNKTNRVIFFKITFGLLINPVRIIIDDTLVMPVDDHPQLAVDTRQLLHALEHLVDAGFRRHVECGCHGPLSDRSHLVDEPSPLPVRLRSHQDVVHPQSEPLPLQEVREELRQSAQQLRRVLSSVQLESETESCGYREKLSRSVTV